MDFISDVLLDILVSFLFFSGRTILVAKTVRSRRANTCSDWLWSGRLAKEGIFHHCFLSLLAFLFARYTGVFPQKLKH
jgi:hypothetical protein